MHRPDGAIGCGRMTATSTLFFRIFATAIRRRPPPGMMRHCRAGRASRDVVRRIFGGDFEFTMNGENAFFFQLPATADAHVWARARHDGADASGGDSGPRVKWGE